MDIDKREVHGKKSNPLLQNDARGQKHPRELYKFGMLLMSSNAVCEYSATCKIPKFDIVSY